MSERGMKAWVKAEKLRANPPIATLLDGAGCPT
jgi:hypothetical protein